MRLKILNESNEIPFILYDEPLFSEGMWDDFTNWASQGLSNIWARVTGGVAQNTMTGENGKTSTNLTIFNSGNPNMNYEKTAADIAKNTTGTTNITRQDSWMQNLGSGVKKLGDKFNKGEWLNEKINALGTFIQKHPETSAVGLAAAGLLGTYYLFKKFKKKEKLTPEMVKNMEKMDNMTPEQVKARMGQGALK